MIDLNVGNRPKGNETVSDYFPLSQEEIKELLEMSLDPNISRIKIKGRLNRGIKGMTCPIPNQGFMPVKVDMVMSALDEWCRQRDMEVIDDFVKGIDQILNH